MDNAVSHSSSSLASASALAAATKTTPSHALDVDDNTDSAHVKRVHQDPDDMRGDMTLIVAYQLPTLRGEPAALLFVRESTIVKETKQTKPRLCQALIDLLNLFYCGSPGQQPPYGSLNILMLFATDRCGTRWFPERKWISLSLPTVLGSQYMAKIESGVNGDAAHAEATLALAEYAVANGVCSRPPMFVQSGDEDMCNANGPLAAPAQAFRLVHSVWRLSCVPWSSCLEDVIYNSPGDRPETGLKCLDSDDRALLVCYRDCIRFVTSDIVSVHCQAEWDWLHSPEAAQPANSRSMIAALAKCALVVDYRADSIAQIELRARQVRLQLWDLFKNPADRAKSMPGSSLLRGETWMQRQLTKDKQAQRRGYAVLWKANEQMAKRVPGWIFESMSPCAYGDVPFAMLESSCNAPVTQVLCFYTGNELWASNYDSVRAVLNNK